MLGWLLPVIGVLATVLAAPFINHKLQQRRDRERERRETRAAWVARQRELCITLLDAVIQSKTVLFTIRSLHDDRSSRITGKKSIELLSQELSPFAETVRSVRRELDLEPNAQLQGAIERWSEATRAYMQALIRPMSSWWNPVQFYLGRSPQDEVNRLADEFDARTHELQDATRAYMASLETPAKAWLSLITESLRQWMHKIHQLASRHTGRAPAN